MKAKRRIVLAGGTGFLGSLLVSHFLNLEWEVLVLTRKLANPIDGATYVVWGDTRRDDWMLALEGSDVLVNLCGKSVDCRYTDKNKAAIYESRIVPTQRLGEAVRLCEKPPKLWINMSSATVYRHALDKSMNEEMGELGQGFSEDVVKKWERTFFDEQVWGTRKVALRTSLVLGPQGGPWPIFRSLTSVGLGGKQGSGSQMVSWLHHQDFVDIVEWLVTKPAIEGVVNATSPDPLRNKLFMQLIRQTAKIPIGIPAPRLLIEVAAWARRTEAELLLKSRWVLPTRLQQEGFQFQYPVWSGAVRQLFAPVRHNAQKSNTVAFSHKLTTSKANT